MIDPALSSQKVAGALKSANGGKVADLIPQLYPDAPRSRAAAQVRAKLDRMRESGTVARELDGRGRYVYSLTVHGERVFGYRERRFLSSLGELE